jgi:hypothetical protein
MLLGSIHFAMPTMISYSLSLIDNEQVFSYRWLIVNNIIISICTKLCKVIIKNYMLSYILKLFRLDMFSLGLGHCLRAKA